jgi:hypothetical protein
MGERRVAAAIAATGDKGYARHVSGFRRDGVDKAVMRPPVQAEIARIQTERLFNEVLPLAVQVHIDLLTSPATPAGAKVQAVKLAYDRTLGVEGADKTKQPHEMTPDELAKALAEAKLKAAALESVQADRARPVLEHEPDEQADEGDIFG